MLTVPQPHVSLGNQTTPEVRWGDTLTVAAAAGAPISPSSADKRLVTIADTYARTWRIRTLIQLSRVLVAGESLTVRFRMSESAGSGTFEWLQGETIPLGVSTVGPTSHDVSASQFLVDAQFESGTLLTDLRYSMMAWGAPQFPVFPSAARR